VKPRQPVTLGVARVPIPADTFWEMRVVQAISSV